MGPGLGILKLYHIRHASGLGPGLGSLKYTILRKLALARTTNQFGVACITYCTTENRILPQLLVRRNAGLVRHWRAKMTLQPLDVAIRHYRATNEKPMHWRTRASATWTVSVPQRLCASYVQEVCLCLRAQGTNVVRTTHVDGDKKCTGWVGTLQRRCAKRKNKKTGWLR